MRIFLIHDPNDVEAAEQIERALQGAKHSVYRRNGKIESAKSQLAAIRDSIVKSDFVLFLATKASSSVGSVALSDIAIAREKWRDPKGRILVLRTDHAPPVENETQLKALRQAGPLSNSGEIGNLISQEYSLRRRSRSFSYATTAILAAAVPLAAVAYYLSSGTGGPSRVPDNIEFVVVNDYMDGNEFDYGETITFGETLHFKLKQTAGADFNFKCKAGPVRTANIKDVSHDEKCTEIKVTAADGPFVDASGTPYSGGNYSPEHDVVPVAVETLDGQEVFRTSFQFPVSNGGTGLLLKGLERAPEIWPGDLSTKFTFAPGQDYEVELITKSGSPIPTAWTCEHNRKKEYKEPEYRLTTVSGCKFLLTNAQAGSLWIDMTRTDPAAEQRVLLDLVERERPSTESADPSGFGVSPDQMLDGLRNDRKRLGGWLERRQRTLPKDQAEGDWYLNYLKSLVGDLDVAINRISYPASPIADQPNAQDDYRRNSLLEQISGIRMVAQKHQETLDKRLAQVAGREDEPDFTSQLDRYREQLAASQSHLAELTQAYEKEFGEPPP